MLFEGKRLGFSKGSKRGIEGWEGGKEMRNTKIKQAKKGKTVRVKGRVEQNTV